MTEQVKINLGCGQRKRGGYVNIDKYPTFAPDLLWDLEKTPYPFEAGSVAEISATHVLEHLGQQTDVFLAIIKEFYRILAPGGTIEIKVPHPRSDGYWNDPTHVRPITPEAIGLFSKKNCRMFAEKGWPNTPLADYLDIDFEIISTKMTLTSSWTNRHLAGEVLPPAEMGRALESQWNVIDEITMIVRKF